MKREHRNGDKGLVSYYGRVASNLLTKGDKFMALTASGSGVYILELQNLVSKRLVHVNILPIAAARMVHLVLADSDANTVKITLTDHANTGTDTDFNIEIVVSETELEYANA